MLNQWYYIAFTKDESGLYHKFEKDGFNHCFIFFDMGDKCFIVEHGKMYVSFGMVSEEQILEHIGDGVVLKVRSKRTPRAKWWWWLWTPDTCVTICKQVLGINAPFVLTPYQLYKHIKKEYKWEAVTL